MSIPYSRQEELVQQAIDEYEDGHFRSATAAAKHYGLKPRHVQRRLRGQASRSIHTLTHTRLDSAQKQASCDYIDHLDNIEHSIRLKHIQGAAEYLLVPLVSGHLRKSPCCATRYLHNRLTYGKTLAQESVDDRPS